MMCDDWRTKVGKTALPGRLSLDGLERPLSRSWRATSLLCLAAAIALGTGCSSDAGSSTGPSLTTAGADSAAGQTTAQVKLDIASWDDVQKYVADQKGKVVVLDLWSSSCEPCIKELPGLATLHQEYSDHVACVSVNLDYIGLPDEPPETHREAAAKILREKGVTCQNFLSSDPDEEVYKKLGAAAVPVVLVYDREGKLAKRFDNEKNEYGQEGFTYKDHIGPFVKELVAAKGS